jgi:hypothetical protein
MASIKRVKWSGLDPAMRAELEAILAAHRGRQSPLGERFHNDSDELMPFVLLAGLAAVGGLIACVYLITSDTMPEGLTYGDHLRMLVQNPLSLVTSPEGGVVGCALVALFLLMFWVRHRGRRGQAITDNALVIVRGPRVKVIPLAEVAGTSQSSHGKRGKRFSVLAVTFKDGGRKELIATKNWADEAERRVAGVG